MNEYYTADLIARGSRARSADPNAEFSAIEAAFDRLPDPAALVSGMLAFGATTGSGNAYAMTVTPPIPALVAGVTINAFLNHTNTGAATLTLGEHPAKAIRTYAGDAIPSGTLIEGQTVTLRYDGSVFRLDARISLDAGEMTPAQLRDFMGLTGYGEDAPIVPDHIPYSNFNDIVVPGVYNIPLPNVMGNSPDTTSGILRVTRRNSERVVQEWMRITGGLTGAGRNYSRALTGAGWSAWFLDYHQGTILGTVAQSGGVPTGALVEAGGSATSGYRRYADGIQECWRTGVALTQDGANQLIYGFTYQVPFAATPFERKLTLPFTSGNFVNVGISDIGGTGAGTGTTAATFAARRSNGASNFPSNATVTDCAVYARGLWF